jgi:hypothetical protein
MKKTFLGLVALGMLSVACKKKTETPTSTTGTATVEGYIKADLNLRNDTLPDGTPQIMREGIPSSVTLTFVIDSKDLEKNPDPAYTYDLIKKTTSVDASGHYSIDLPTPSGSNTINGTLEISDFDYKPIVTSSTNTDSAAARVVFTAPAQNFQIYNGGKTIVDYNY